MDAAIHLSLAAGTPAWLIPVTATLAAISLVFLGFELVRGRASVALRSAVGVTGFVGIALLAAAVLRPERVDAKENSVPAKVTLLLDQSQSMALSEEGKARTARRDEAVAALEARGGAKGGVRLEKVGFADGLSDGEGGPRSDLSKALTELTEPRGSALENRGTSAERPKAIVLFSDGRLDDPSAEADEHMLKRLAPAGMPIHTVLTAGPTVADASVASVRSTGNAVAHAPLALRIGVVCTDRLSCNEIPVTVSELREDGPKVALARGVATVKEGRGEVEVPITLDRAGTRVIEVAIDAPSGDTIAENNHRFLPFAVTRDRVRVLHVAGRPTNDVRTLRDWLKSDRAVDVVSFFILRTPTDNPHATPSDLSLIPFPVDELFTEHLPSFDAVVLQDFDAQPYGLERHLGQLSRYVRGGGGIVMVGGPNSFVAGGYANTPLADVLPVLLDGAPGATSADLGDVVPSYTAEGRGAALLAPLRGLAGEELPAMPGTNIVGAVRPGALALWVHPSRNAGKDGAKMPILALGDAENGRSIALTVDGSWTLAFSSLGERTGGRAHAAFWDGLLGWLMRDSRYELLQVGLESPCVAAPPSDAPPTEATAKRPVLRVRGATDATAVTLEVRKMGGTAQKAMAVSAPVTRGKDLLFTLPALPPGGFTARAKLRGGFSTTFDFACEAGGDEWADVRPDEGRLQRLAAATGGTFVRSDALGSLPLPAPTVITVERRSRPLLANWLWAFLAAAALGGHWVLRRQAKLL